MNASPWQTLGVYRYLGPRLNQTRPLELRDRKMSFGSSIIKCSLRFALIFTVTFEV